MIPIQKIIDLLDEEYPMPKVALKYDDVFQLLVAVILSAQCTDERVNKVTPALFKRFPGIRDFARCDLDELEKLIFSTGFYKNKAKNIKRAAIKIVEDFEEKVPDKMEDLLTLPGVARKTANVVLHAGFGKEEGIVVDTHVARLSGLLGLVPMKMSKAKDAIKIEKELMAIVPREYWGDFSMWLILHGRKICIARRPKCEECVLNKLCPSAFVAKQLQLT